MSPISLANLSGMTPANATMDHYFNFFRDVRDLCFYMSDISGTPPNISEATDEICVERKTTRLAETLVGASLEFDNERPS